MVMSKEQTLRLFKQVTKGKDWIIVENYLADRRESLVTRLISCQPDDLKNLQGQITIIDEMLRLSA